MEFLLALLDLYIPACSMVLESLHIFIQPILLWLLPMLITLTMGEISSIKLQKMVSLINIIYIFKIVTIVIAIVEYMDRVLKKG